MTNVTIQNYEQLRKELIDEDLNLVGNILSEKELVINKKLELLIDEYKNQYEEVPYNVPVLKDEKIRNSKLYEFFMKLPKGSDLHVHGTSLLPMNKLIEFIKDEPKLFININDYKLSLIKDDNTMSLKQALDNNVIDYEELFKKWTILGVKHKENRWDYFENLFSYFEAIDLDYDVLNHYYEVAFNYYNDLHINHVEIHLLLDNDLEAATKTIKTIKNAYYKVKNNNPNFSVLIIGSGMKLIDYSMDDAFKRLENTYILMNQIKDDYDPNNIHNFIVGFDLINEEDSSRPLKEYATKLLEFKNNHPDFKFFLHSGESLDPDSSNLIDAYLLGATRVGHGFNLYRYPNLMNKYINKELCLEVCPISNQALAYTKNLRNHPFFEYIKRGVTVSLCSDDPIFFENQTLVDDFFAMSVCFDLNLQDIKQLCINSIMCSSLDNNIKRLHLKYWKKQYDEFIDSF